MFRDGVFETSETTGTGPLTLAGPVTGARSFRSAFGDGPVTVGYVIRSAPEDGQFETGVGSFEHTGGSDVLTRTTVLASSNSGAAVDWPPGTRNVWCGPLAEVLDGLLAGNKDSARPAWVQAGGTWVDVVSATEWNCYLFDGSDDILLGTINPTANTWTAKGTRWAMGTAIDDDDIDGDNILTLPTDGNVFAFTGTQTVDEIASVGVGTEVELHFGSARTLTHSADLDLPGGANITTADGDVARFREVASGDWVCTSYERGNGLPLAVIDEDDMASDSAVHVPTQQSVKAYVDARAPAAASQADMEAASSTTAPVTPGRQQYHPSAAKVWVHFDQTGTLTNNASYGVSSLTDTGTGRTLVNFATAFSSANYACLVSCEQDATPPNGLNVAVERGSQTAGSVGIECRINTGFADRDNVYLVCFGDQ